MNNLEIFNYQDSQNIRTIDIDGMVWFVARDVAKALGYVIPHKAVKTHCKPKGVLKRSVPTRGGKQEVLLINEPNIYRLVARSKLPTAEKFEDWIFEEVIPQILKTGSYEVKNKKYSPLFVQRFNDNCMRIEPGYFAVISELMVRVYGKFEMFGYQLPNVGTNEKELRPDVSVGKRFPKWLKNKAPHMVGEFKYYMHKLPSGKEVRARQYKNEALALFIEYIETEWLVNCAPNYLEQRDKKALEYLPKVLKMLGA